MEIILTIGKKPCWCEVETGGTTPPDLVKYKDDVYRHRGEFKYTCSPRDDRHLDSDGVPEVTLLGVIGG